MDTTKQISHYSNLTYEQLMKYTRNKLREISKLFNLSYTANTLKAELATRIAKHTDHSIHNPYEINQSTLINDSIQPIQDQNYILSAQYNSNLYKVYSKDLNAELSYDLPTHELRDNPDYYLPKTNIFIEDLLDKEYPRIKYLVNQQNYHNKFSITITADFIKSSDTNTIKEFPIPSNYYYPYETNLKSRIINDFSQIVENLVFQESGWSLYNIKEIALKIQEVTLFPGGTYIQLPKQFLIKRALLNIDNSLDNDNRCFLWSVLAHFHNDNIQSSKRNKMQSYFPFINQFNQASLTFPVEYTKISNFETDNNLYINVYSLIDDNNPNSEIIPIRVSERIKTLYQSLLTKIDTDYINNSEDEFIINVDKDLKDINNSIISLFYYKNHYSLITNFNSFFSDYLKDTHSSRNRICHFCRTKTSSIKVFINHIRFCLSLEKHAFVKLPSPTKTIKDETIPNIIKFKNISNGVKVPFVVSADFETIQIPTIKTPKTESSDRKYLTKHVPTQFGYYINSSISTYNHKPVIYTGNNADKIFIDKLVEELVTNKDSIYNKYYRFKKLKVPYPLYDSSQAKICSICSNEFKSAVKVIDHCHFTGNFRGYAHQSCNVNFRDPNFIPVYLHNLSGYDAHLFINNLISHPSYVQNTFRAIPITTENYLSFEAKFSAGTFYNKENKLCHAGIKLRFLDSNRLMPARLEELANNLTEKPTIDKLFPNGKLLHQKGVFPYEYMDSFDKYKETKLPSLEKFYSKLNNSNITKDEYNHAQNVWNHFKIKNLQEYSELYLLTDVLLLSDIIDSFRNTCLINYKLDPCHYYTAASLSWDAMLKYTKVTLEYIYKQDILEFFEKQIRGGISIAIHRYAEANNKYLPNFDPSKPSTFITYEDVNNLYGWAMSQKLPTGNFKWLTQQEISTFIKKFFNNQIDLESNIGYTLEVDIDYPKELHDEHDDLPFLSENIKINKTTKLTPNLNNKRHYVLNIKSLHQALKHGLKLVKIHRIISYDQSDWLKSYIDENSKRRAKSANDFEKNFFKLMNNVIYGKTMENVRKRVNIKFCTNEESIKSESSKATAVTKMFSESFAAITLNKYEVTMDKPIYIGAQILDISKLLMYQFHYEYMKPKFPIQKLCYMDCDSFIYYIHTEDFYKDISSDINQWFDTSCYTVSKGDIPLNINKKVPGKFKDEVSDKEISHFVALRAKMYAFYTNNDVLDTTKHIKGIKKSIQKTEISFQDLYKTLFNLNTFEERQRKIVRFHHENHDIYTIEETKIALDANDDKRILLKDGINTLAIGHYKAKFSIKDIE